MRDIGLTSVYIVNNVRHACYCTTYGNTITTQPSLPVQTESFIGTACIVCREGSMKHGIYQSVPATAHSSKPDARGLLLWVRRAGDINRLLLHAVADKCSTARLSAYKCS